MSYYPSGIHDFWFRSIIDLISIHLRNLNGFSMNLLRDCDWIFNAQHWRLRFRVSLNTRARITAEGNHDRPITNTVTSLSTTWNPCGTTKPKRWRPRISLIPLRIFVFLLNFQLPCYCFTPANVIYQTQTSKVYPRPLPDNTCSVTWHLKCPCVSVLDYLLHVENQNKKRSKNEGPNSERTLTVGDFPWANLKCHC